MFPLPSSRSFASPFLLMRIISSCVEVESIHTCEEECVRVQKCLFIPPFPVYLVLFSFQILFLMEKCRALFFNHESILPSAVRVVAEDHFPKYFCANIANGSFFLDFPSLCSSLCLYLSVPLFIVGLMLTFFYFLMIPVFVCLWSLACPLDIDPRSGDKINEKRLDNESRAQPESGDDEVLPNAGSRSHASTVKNPPDEL